VAASALAGCRFNPSRDGLNSSPEMAESHADISAHGNAMGIKNAPSSNCALKEQYIYIQ